MSDSLLPWGVEAFMHVVACTREGFSCGSKLKLQEYSLDSVVILSFHIDHKTDGGLIVALPIRNSRFPLLLGRLLVMEHQFRLLGRRHIQRQHVLRVGPP
jgi:hypothetical protein